MAILPYSPQYWVIGVISPTNCIKEIFDVGETKLRYSRTAMIKL